MGILGLEEEALLVIRDVPVLAQLLDVDGVAEAVDEPLLVLGLGEMGSVSNRAHGAPPWTVCHSCAGVVYARDAALRGWPIGSPELRTRRKSLDRLERRG